MIILVVVKPRPGILKILEDCVPVCACVCVYAHVLIYEHKYMYIRISICVYMYVLLCVHTCARVGVRACMHVCVRMCVCMRVSWQTHPYTREGSNPLPLSNNCNLVFTSFRSVTPLEFMSLPPPSYEESRFTPIIFSQHPFDYLLLSLKLSKLKL